MIGVNLTKPGEEAQDPREAPVGPFQRSDEELVTQVHAWFKESADAKADIARKRKEDWKQLAGDQWHHEDARVVEGQKRPKLTLNMLFAIMAAVEGEERTNRQEIHLYGEEEGDDQTATGLNRLLKWVMNQCGGEFALSQMFRSGAAVGEGWVVPEVDFFEDPEGKIKLLYVDDDECFDDPLGTCPVASDSRAFVRVKMLNMDELDARWPGARTKLSPGAINGVATTETDGSGYRDIYLTPDDPKSPKLYDAQKKQWAVLECWWSQIEPGWAVVDEATDMLVEKSTEEFEALKAQREQERQAWAQQMAAGALPQVPIGPPILPGGQPQMGPPPLPPQLQASQRPIKCIYQAFVSSNVLLAKAKSPLKELKRQPYVPFRAIWDKVKHEWRGLIRDIIDPQRQHNVEQSVIVQLMQLMPKQAWYGPKGSFHNKQEWQEKIAQPGAMLEYNGTRGKPEPVPAPTIPRHLIDMAFSRPAAMREICGVNIEMTGQRVASDPGVVMEMRKKAAQTVLAPIFDNFRQSKKAVGEVLLAYIQTYVKRGRRIRVLGEKGARYVAMTEQMQLGRFDIVVEETNSTINDRIATLNILQTTLPALMKAGVSPPPEFIDLMPMPAHVRDEWKRQIAWEMAIAGRIPPPGWQPGMPVPQPGLPAPGMPPQSGVFPPQPPVQ